jgi:hypothetical protein
MATRWRLPGPVNPPIDAPDGRPRLALRAPRFDGPSAPAHPVFIRGDLGIDLRTQSKFTRRPPRAACTAWPWRTARVHVLLPGGRLPGLRAAARTGHGATCRQIDARLPFWQRWLGDETPTLAYGSLLEGVTREKSWLIGQLDYAASDDFRVISTLGWLYRVRKHAAETLYEQQMWQLEPGGALAADYETALSEAARALRDESLRLVRDAPWSTLSSARKLRAEIFAAQLRAYLRREFDEEWWRSNRAARFVVQELWRPGRRFSAEELLGFMGFEGFDAGILWAECAEVLSAL